MIHRILLFSEEVEDFVMEIKAPSTATFKELHELIMQKCSYVESGNHRFLICDEDWRVRDKIYLYEKESISSEEDMNLMNCCQLGDFIEDEGQHIAYIYDVDGKRNFLLHVAENIFGEKLPKPIVSRSKGQAPEQTLHVLSPKVEINEPQVGNNRQETNIDDFEIEHQEDVFEDSELDPDGFEIS